MPYAPGTILCSTSERRSYNTLRVIRQVNRPYEMYGIEIVELRPQTTATLVVGDTRLRSRSHLDDYGYSPVEHIESSREEVKMKIHTLIHNSPDVATPVSAVTMPEGAFNGPEIATRRFDGRAWLIEDEPTWNVTDEWPVLIEFSDGTLGVTAENHLSAALATFELQLVTS